METTTSSEEIQLQTGYAPSPEEEFYFNWGQESVKSNLSLANKLLNDIVTLSSVLLGGSLIFLDENFVAPYIKISVSISFLIALACAFYGVLPYEGHVALNVPEEIKAHKKRGSMLKSVGS